MIKIEYCNDDLISFELDIEIFKKKYPSIFKQQKFELDDLDYYDLEEIIPDDDSVADLTLKKESVILKLPNTTTQTIYNTDILSWFHSYEDGYAIKTDSKFVYFIIYSPFGQAGALGIWDTDKEGWIFNHNEVSFCVESILYSNKLDAFIGYYEWNIPMSLQYGEGFFIVNERREYKDIVVDKFTTKYASNNKFICSDFVNFKKTLCLNEDDLLIYIKYENEHDDYEYKKNLSNFDINDLIDCGETQKKLNIDNTPKSLETFHALGDLLSNILNPLVGHFRDIELTYGFCSLELLKNIPGKISPKVDQHSSHEKNSRGSLICDRLGAACDFYVKGKSSLIVAKWIVENLDFDRIYYYGDNLPIHVSYGPDHSKQIVVMNKGKSGKLLPKVVKPNFFNIIINGDGAR